MYDNDLLVYVLLRERMVDLFGPDSRRHFFSVVDFLRPMCNTNETRHGDAWTPRVAAVPRSCSRLRKSQLESLLLKSISLGRSAEVTFTNGNDWTSISAAAKANMSVLGPYSSLVTEN